MLNQVDSKTNIFGPSSRIIALVKSVHVFGVDIFGITRVKFCRVRNIEKQLSFVLSEERSLKSSLTKYLNELAVEFSLEAPKKEKITERLQDIEKRRDELLEFNIG